ncbi:MAG: pentapeptide repeat-containing protein [Cyanobacteria bacterium P01_H01_bin.21]
MNLNAFSRSAEKSLQDLKGQSFAHQALQGTNFSGCYGGVLPHWRLFSGLLAHVTGHLIGFIAALVSYFLLSENFSNQLTGIGSCAILVILWLVLWKRGLGRAIATVTGAVVLYGVLAGIIAVAFSPAQVSESTLLLVSAFTLIVGGTIWAISSLIGTQLVVGRASVLLFALGIILNVLLVPRFGQSPIATTIAQAGNTGLAITISLVLALSLICGHISKTVLSDSSQHQILRRLGIAWSTLGNTSFYRANLTTANFAGTHLAGTDFRQATLKYVNWRGATGLRWARWGESQLADARVVELLTQNLGHWREYCSVDLSFTDLAGADLCKLNLAQANLTGANLRGANLEGTTLTNVTAIGADLTEARLTGACLQNWSIDASTQLDRVDCRYVYLREHPKPGTDDCDRKPATGEFEPGDFVRLYQTVVDTVELIFRDGIDWKAFHASLEKARQANPATDLVMQSIETKGDGYVVIKLKVEGPDSKADIHQTLTQQYEAQLKALEGSYRQALESQLNKYQEQTQAILQIQAQLAQQPRQVPENIGQSVIITFPHGSLSEGFTVFVQVWSAAQTLLRTQVGSLPGNPKLLVAYQRWQQLYQAQQPFFYDGMECNTVTNFSRVEFNQTADSVLQGINTWLNSPGFQPIDQCLRSALEPAQAITMTWQMDDMALQQLPLHSWHFFDDYPKAALTYSFLNTRHIPTVKVQRQHKRVLLVLGMADGLDVEADKTLWQSLPSVTVRCLVRPTVQKLNEALWEAEGWDIFCFSGHSAFQGDRIWLNEKEFLSLDDLKYALRQATQQGLSLSIFNCCQGLKLAQQFTNAISTGITVMREPVPDQIAQQFLRYLVENLNTQTTTAHAVKAAREQLQGLELDFPWTSWLPAIFEDANEI